MDTASPIQWLNMIGLLFDLSAALALSRGFFALNDQQLKRLSGSYFGSNPSTLRSFCEQRRDTRFGLTQLVIGAIIQIASTIGLNVPPVAALVCGSGLAISWTYYVATYKEVTAEESLLLSITAGATQKVWREVHFADLSDLEWDRIIINNDVIFPGDQGQN